MVTVTEYLNFEFYLILINFNLNLKHTRFSYWETYVCLGQVGV